MIEGREASKKLGYLTQPASSKVVDAACLMSMSWRSVGFSSLLADTTLARSRLACVPEHVRRPAGSGVYLRDERPYPCRL